MCMVYGVGDTKSPYTIHFRYFQGVYKSYFVFILFCIKSKGIFYVYGVREYLGFNDCSRKNGCGTIWVMNTTVMRKLNTKEEAFAADVAGGMHQTDAYRKHYNVQPHTTPESVVATASRIATRPHVAARIKEIRQPVIDKLAATGQLTLERHLQTLADLRDEARSSGQYGAAVKAEVARGKAVGLYIERVETHLTTGEKPKTLADFYDEPLLIPKP